MPNPPNGAPVIETPLSAMGLGAPSRPESLIPHSNAIDTEIRATRVQAAVVRSLLDELDDALPPTGSERLRSMFEAQAAEEIEQLANRLLSLAGLMTLRRV